MSKQRKASGSELSAGSGIRFSRRALIASLFCATRTAALGRRAYGGSMRMAVPWAINRLDPHELDDAVAALFGSAICDPLYALDSGGRPYPALSRSLPQAVSGGARIQLRQGLVTSGGRPLLAADLRASLLRCQRRGAAALLADLRAFRAVAGDTTSLDLIGVEVSTLAERLATPLTALLPRDYSPLEPDGTGAFRARLERGQLVLTRNLNAARGPAFLDRIEVSTTTDLADALRAFEAGTLDVGWLGSGLHRPRSGSEAFVGAAYGWAILRTGRARRGWGAPGVAQQLIDGIEPERFRHLGIEGLPSTTRPALGWGGGPSELHVADDAPQLLLLARTLAAALERPGHELRVTAIARPELARRRQTDDYVLLVDFVRQCGPPGPMTQLALLSAQSPELAKRPPYVASYDPRLIARGLDFGVIGELWATGAHAPGLFGLSGWQLGEVTRLTVPS